MNNYYQNGRNKVFTLILLFVASLFSKISNAQTIISTEAGTNYNGASGVAPATPEAPASITFVIQNTNASPITLTQVDSYCKTSQDGTTQKLWYSTSSLSGAPTIASPAWTLIGTGTSIAVPSNGYYPAITGLSFSIPAGAQYRFAIESSNGISYTNQASAPTPNTFSNAGVNLKLFDVQIGGAVIGFGGGFPSPTFNPRAFTGRITFTAAPTTAPSCATGLSPANGATGISPTGSLNWTSTAGASSYDVFFGTSATPPLVGNFATTSYTFSPSLSLGTVYFYKIVPKNSAGSASGCSTYSFTTTSCFLPTAAVTTPDTSYCGTASATLRVTGGSLNSATQWVWYSGSCGGTPAGTGTSITVSPATTTSYFVRGEGGCVTPGSGTCATVTVTKSTTLGAPTVNPIASICAGSIGSLSISSFTLGTIPIPDSITVTSGTVSLAVPDNVNTGITSTLNVPALSPGSQITKIEVTLNMTHTYPGDMIFNLKAPNGKILNLYKYAGGAFSGNAGGLTGAGWFNAVTSSTATRKYNSVTSVYAYGRPTSPGPFAADTLNRPVLDGAATPAPLPVQNPAGYVSDAARFSDLYSIASGSWTLAMADGGLGDLGTLTNWKIKIYYNKFALVPSPAGIWAPTDSLYVDAAGLVPYNGTTSLFQVYAKPKTTTTYTVTSVSGSCASAPTPATLIVFDSAVINRDPVNVTICEFGTTKLIGSATGTTPTFQWLVDTGDGNFNAIANGANYAGATTDTLTIKGAPRGWSGYKYKLSAKSSAPCLPSDSSLTAVLSVNLTPDVTLLGNPITNLFPSLTTQIIVSSIPVR